MPESIEIHEPLQFATLWLAVHRANHSKFSRAVHAVHSGLRIKAAIVQTVEHGPGKSDISYCIIK